MKHGSLTKQKMIKILQELAKVIERYRLNGVTAASLALTDSIQ